MSIAPFETAVLDSSVIIKWFREGEPLRTQALALRSAYLQRAFDLVVPDLLFYEVSNVLRYKTDLPTNVVCAIVQSLYDMNMAIISITADLVTQSIRLAREYDLTVYDAAFVACADQVGGSLITADDALFRKMSSYPSVVHLASIAVP